MADPRHPHRNGPSPSTDYLEERERRIADVIKRARKQAKVESLPYPSNRRPPNDPPPSDET